MGGAWRLRWDLTGVCGHGVKAGIPCLQATYWKHHTNSVEFHRSIPNTRSTPVFDIHTRFRQKPKLEQTRQGCALLGIYRRRSKPNPTSQDVLPSSHQGSQHFTGDFPIWDIYARSMRMRIGVLASARYFRMFFKGCISITAETYIT